MHPVQEKVVSRGKLGRHLALADQSAALAVLCAITAARQIQKPGTRADRAPQSVHDSSSGRQQRKAGVQECSAALFGQSTVQLPAAGRQHVAERKYLAKLTAGIR